MNEAIINDFKQFITAPIAQQTSHLATKGDLTDLQEDISGIKEDITRLDHKIDTLQAAVQQSAIDYTSTVDAQVQDHEQQRIKRLEQRAA
jgi:hypothetical protein